MDTNQVSMLWTVWHSLAVHQ